MAWRLNSRSATILVILAAYVGFRYLNPPRIKSPVIRTSLGYLQGSVSSSLSRGGREFLEYLAIPYAAPPVGDFRYAPPQLPNSWSGVRDASAYASPCMQNPAYVGPIHGDEDCLYLNVFVPKLRRGEGAKLLPVIVYFHGGHFEEGSPDQYRPNYWMDEDIVLVVPAYRMNSFGFLNTGDGIVRGNMGLKDQVMALIWIQENAEVFDGDPYRMTIFGQSAGGTSVHYHLISPISQGLFQRAISQSGTAVASWPLARNPAQQARRLAGQLNCPTENTTEMVACMRKVPAHDIALVHEEMKDTLRDPNAMFLPSIEVIDDEQAFLLQHPRRVLDSGQDGRGVPWLVGVTSEEGSLFWGMSQRNATTKARLCDSDFWNARILDLLGLPNEQGKSDADKQLVKAIREHYFGPNGDICDVERFQAQYTRMFSHPTFFNGFDTATRAHARHTPTYAYYFDHVGTGSLVQVTDIPGRFNLMLEIMLLYVKAQILTFFGAQPIRMGVAHADDLHYLWSLLPIAEGPDTELSKAYVKMFAQFARDESRTRFLGVKLEPTKSAVANNASEPLQVLEISMRPRYIPFPHADEVRFWNSLKVL